MEKETIASLTSLFDRDLVKLSQEITQYADENDLWKIDGEIKNSAGNLCLHLCGNLEHFIGAVLGNSGYKRDRENEFSAKNLSRAELLKEVETTRAVIAKTLPLMDAASLSKAYPIEVFGSPMSTIFFIIHLQGHLNYHLGQVNYHRRLIAPGG